MKMTLMAAALATGAFSLATPSTAEAGCRGPVPGYGYGGGYGYGVPVYAPPVRAVPAYGYGYSPYRGRFDDFDRGYRGRGFGNVGYRNVGYGGRGFGRDGVSVWGRNGGLSLRW